ncbi:MAG: acyl-CoA carboxylase subunit beta [Chloroflexi bacterium]|nr:acyl-CoA carboxylase subunit beta [Chloroflexota bacterium]
MKWLADKTTAEKIAEAQGKRERILQMGNTRLIEERHQKGQMSARERVEYFFDPGTFTEVGLWVKPRSTDFGMDKREVPAEGVITGFGKVNGRNVMVASQDFTAMGGSAGEYHCLKYAHAIDFAKMKGFPFVSMIDSGGLRFQEGMDAMEAYSVLFRAQNLASGIVPEIALLMGPCLGGHGYLPVMHDFVIQVKETGYLGIAGPAVVKAEISEEIGLEELAGWKAHAIKSGQTHVVAENDKDCLDKAKELLSFLPSNSKQAPPCIKTSDDPDRIIAELDTILPERQDQPWDMHKLISRIADDGKFYEILPYHARNIITCFTRFGGRPVGIVAGQPMVMGGALTVDAADKGARFIRFCDMFNIPLLALHDSPAMMVGSEQEWKGILRHGVKLLYSWSNATVPLIAVSVRKANGGSYHGMLNKSMGADFFFAWPTATMFGGTAAAAASIVCAKEIREAPNPEEVRIKRTTEFKELWENPYRAAERGYVDDIITPRDTRKMVNRALDALADKIVAMPARKAYNITL